MILTDKQKNKMWSIVAELNSEGFTMNEKMELLNETIRVIHRG